MLRDALDFPKSHGKAENKWKEKNADFQASPASRKSYFPMSWACQRAFARGLPARAYLGCVSSRALPSLVKAWFTKGPVFSPFMYHSWNSESREAFLKQEAARSDFVSVTFCWGISVEHNPGLAHWWVMCRTSCPAPRVSAYVYAQHSHFQQRSGAVQYP